MGPGVGVGAGGAISGMNSATTAGVSGGVNGRVSRSVGTGRAGECTGVGGGVGSAGLGNSRSRVTVVVGDAGDAGGGRGASGASKRWLYSHRAPAPCNRTEAPTANQTHPGTGRRVSPKSIGLTAGPSASLIIMAV